MDQPTPDRPAADEPPAPESTPAPTVLPVSARDERVRARLQSLVGADEPIAAWARGWVSREVRLHGLLAARTFDFAAVTDHDLVMFSTGFFTRRPRRRVYASSLDRIQVADHDRPRGQRLRITSRGHRPLWIEMNMSPRATAFADALLARTRRELQ
ncbi:MAG TPA: hypothetical protein VIK54_02460 [Acidimicrobiia bacterium]